MHLEKQAMRPSSETTPAHHVPGAEPVPDGWRLGRPGVDWQTHLYGGLSRGTGAVLLSQACPGVPALAQTEGHPPLSLQGLPLSFPFWGRNLATCVSDRAHSCFGNIQKLERPVGVRV